MTSSDSLAGALTIEGLSPSQYARFRSLLDATDDIHVVSEPGEPDQGLVAESVALTLVITVILGVSAARQLAELVYFIYRAASPAQVIDVRDGEVHWHVVQTPGAPRGSIVCVTSQGDQIEVVSPDSAADILGATKELLGVDKDSK